MLAPLPADWIVDGATYESGRDALAFTRIAMITRLKELAKTVIVFQTPLFVDGLEELGFDRRNVERQLTDGIAFCHGIPGVTCLDTSKFAGRREIYRDVAHLNVNGHRIFAEWLINELEPIISAGHNSRNE